MPPRVAAESIDLVRRVYQHRVGDVKFTSRYQIHRLVHFEVAENPLTAIEREKELKGWLRARKVSLIESTNPAWRDLSEGWFD